jgi:AcrR family transcriptional regulator
MPKVIRPADEIEAVKGKILESALSLMCEDGFDGLSMRKLAARLGMTAANIYNYYKNKDELYLVIQTNGFQMLVDRFDAISGSPLPPSEKICAMMRAYIDFGIENPDYYEIMFCRNTPKYADYRDTPMQSKAAFEKETALKLADMACRTIRESRASDKTLGPDRILHMTITAWTALHGVVNLYNSRVLQEVTDHTDRFIDQCLADLHRRFVEG